ncbi:acyl-CoA dehydrogenase family protein [Qipengyuania sediminis]|uniref:acyl-CoA dehydrogenase family protein n=1 Tax=Qipengyuania sediminis TaxID=1532023 RepID=UPI00105A416A|nr:acyl-CoA dehydrogenase family protein [Qipengyuania sediminis]
MTGDARAAGEAARRFAATVQEATGRLVRREGALDAALATREQRRFHGFAWIATTAEALVATACWYEGLEDARDIDRLVLEVAFGEYCAQLAGGVAMGQSEVVRPADYGLAEAARAFAGEPSVAAFLEQGNAPETRAALAQRIASGERPGESVGDGALDMVRGQFRRFAAERIAPRAQAWHLADALIPLDIVAEMAALGVFGVTISEEYGGLGLGKLAMCLVSEELSRGWICAGSLGTRSEIAAELIGTNGTTGQKTRYLPRIADGSILPTAVFTEPDTGSDLASIRTRAVRDPAGGWRIDGAKTWITHAARADLMTVLVRTDLANPGHGGLSMLLAEKSRGTEADPFPDPGLAGEAIDVLGYRGMREYSLGFEGFRVAADGLLGAVEGQGFRQLMQTFESARIQTAARAVGVAWNAFDLGLSYAVDRRQFGNSLLAFPRVADKLALMVAEIVAARELTYAAAREKDAGERCDIVAGMAKLLAARTAWSAADAALQIHGGNGYALEYPISRVLCDARVLNIFEGAGEIQAQVIARGLLMGR